MNHPMYVVWCPSASNATIRQDSAAEARTEARRLCAMPDNHGREFVVMRAVESVQYRTDPFICKTFCKSG